MTTDVYLRGQVRNVLEKILPEILKPFDEENDLDVINVASYLTSICIALSQVVLFKLLESLEPSDVPVSLKELKTFRDFIVESFLEDMQDQINTNYQKMFNYH